MVKTRLDNLVGRIHLKLKCKGFLKNVDHSERLSLSPKELVLS